MSDTSIREEVLALTPNNRPPPTVLYHYTAADGLAGIIKTRELWATHADYMNDASELRYALKVFAQVAKAYKGDEANGGAWTLVKRLIKTRWVRVFAVSMCTKPDLLGQWRGYGTRGGGFSIGFETQALLPFLQRAGFMLVPAIYKQNEQEGVARDIITKHLAAMEEVDFSDSDAARMAATALLTDFLQAIVRLKHPRFRAEKEWRLIRMTSNPIGVAEAQKIEVRACGGRLLPFQRLTVEADDLRTPIKELVIGPRLDPRLDKRAATMLLQHEALTNVAIRVSKIPLRGWSSELP